MPRVTWPLLHGRPRIEIVLNHLLDSRETTRNLLADTGAGSESAVFELLLDEDDCVTCGNVLGTTQLGGAYSGSFPLYGVRVQIPQIGFDRDVRVVGIPSPPSGFDGIAGFRFLNRFTYGNFGDKGQFGLES